MKIIVEIPAGNINGALLEPHSLYWACAAQWDPVTRRGYVVEVGDGMHGGRHALTPSRLKRAIGLMLEKSPGHFARLACGNYDGETGDILLQLMVFGELKYG